MIREVWADPNRRNHVVPDAIRYTLGDFMRFIPDLLGEDHSIRFVADYLALDRQADEATRRRKGRLTFAKAHQYGLAVLSQLRSRYRPGRREYAQPRSAMDRRRTVSAPVERKSRPRKAGQDANHDRSNI